MKPDDRIQGFVVKSVQQLPEFEGQLWLLEHEKTGAGLVWFDRKDDNKTFGIALRTLPEDDTGIFHILEHSVLSGSDRYPTREPFVDLLKSSLSTFLNAMTFPDKTFYPVSSRNNKDFTNLVRVYLDAVFHPLIYSRPEIFRQEGWHFELDDAGNPSYKGVVFNEMKGDMASPDSLMQTEMMRALFPDTSYRFNSGGDPAHIPELTYEQFIEGHKRFYSPSNAYIYLDGSIDLDAMLRIIDGEYLSTMERRFDQPQFTLQKPVRAEPVCVRYEISAGEPTEKRARLGLGFVLGDYRCREEIIAMQALSDVLCGSNQSPLSRRILSEGLAEDIDMSMVDGILQPYVALTLNNMDENRTDEVLKAIREEIARQADGALDHEQLAATLANLEFKVRERDIGPQGLAFGMMVMESWLYGGDPADGLRYSAVFESLNRKLQEGWFESLLRRVFLENDHTCQITLLPSTTLGKEMQAEETARLQAAKSSWSAADVARLRKQQTALIQWQSTPDSEEALATLPKLELSDIDEEPEKIPILQDVTDTVPVLRHAIAANGIEYVSLYFDISDMPAERLSAIALLCSFLGDLDTSAHDTLELQKLCRLTLGALDVSVQSFGGYNAPESCRTFVCASFSALEAKLPQACALVTEILTKTLFDKPEKMRELLRQKLTNTRQVIAEHGNVYAMARMTAGFLSSGVVGEYAAGITEFQWLQKLEEAYDTRVDGLRAEMESLTREIFTTGRLTLGVTGTADSAFEHELIAALPTSERVNRACAVKPWGRRREGIVVPVDVSFAVMGGSLLSCGRAFNGESHVLSHIVSLTYLWNAIRVQGGAYGTGMQMKMNGLVGYYSFRDPSAQRSLQCFRQTADFLEQFCASGVDLTGLIVGAVADSDPLLTPRQKGAVADQYFFSGITHDDLCRMRREMLQITPQKLAGWAEPLRALAQHGGVCVIGSQRQIDACKDDLDDVIVL